MSDAVQVRYLHGHAEALTGNLVLDVARRDAVGRSEACPLEWIAVALGS